MGVLVEPVMPPAPSAPTPSSPAVRHLAKLIPLLRMLLISPMIVLMMVIVLVGNLVGHDRLVLLEGNLKIGIMLGVEPIGVGVWLMIGVGIGGLRGMVEGSLVGGAFEELAMGLFFYLLLKELGGVLVGGVVGL